MAEYAWFGAKVTEEILEELVAVLHRCIDLDMFWYGGDLAQYLALLGTIDEIPAGFPDPYVALARGEWAAAAAFWEERGLPYEQAVALSRGDLGAKADALELLDALGAKPLASRIRRELREAGIQGIRRGPQQATLQSPLGLTPRQSEVLELLNENLTNEEIASRMFVSVRTVENHVSAILTKLDAPNRTQAVELAREARIFS